MNVELCEFLVVHYRNMALRRRIVPICDWKWIHPIPPVWSQHASGDYYTFGRN